MEKLKKLFFGIEMKWWKVIVLAVVTGAYSGLIMMVNFLDETSFQDIGISYECWILFAVIICFNCKTPLEAAVKTFVYFLISQPLCYLVQWPEYHHFPWYYYRFWFFMTLLTFPGGYIAWYGKKQTVFGALVLSVATAFLAMVGVDGMIALIRAGGFPYHLLTHIFCLLLTLCFIFVIQEGKRERIIISAISLAAVVIFGAFMLFGGFNTSVGYYLENCEDAVCTVADESIVSAEPINDAQIDIKAHKKGNTTVTCELKDGTVVVLDVTVEKDGNIIIKQR